MLVSCLSSPPCPGLFMSAHQFLISMASTKKAEAVVVPLALPGAPSDFMKATSSATSLQWLGFAGLFVLQPPPAFPKFALCHFAFTKDLYQSLFLLTERNPKKTFAFTKKKNGERQQ